MKPPTLILSITVWLFFFVSPGTATSATLTQSPAYETQRPCVQDCFYWGASTGGDADLLADRIGCDDEPVENECLCRADLQGDAVSYLRKCVSDNCSKDLDVSSALEIYNDYCTSNGYEAAPITTHAPTATDSDTESQSSTKTSSSATTDSESQRTSFTSTTSSTEDSSTVQPTTSSEPTQGGSNKNNSGGDGNGLGGGEIAGIVVGILGFLATCVGVWISYKSLKAKKVALAVR